MVRLGWVYYLTNVTWVGKFKNRTVELGLKNVKTRSNSTYEHLYLTLNFSRDSILIINWILKLPAKVKTFAQNEGAHDSDDDHTQWAKGSDKHRTFVFHH